MQEIRNYKSETGPVGKPGPSWFVMAPGIGKFQFEIGRLGIDITEVSLFQFFSLKIFSALAAQTKSLFDNPSMA